MVVRALLAGVVALAIPTPGAFAATLPSGATPLPGSTFQGGDGNQDDAAPYVDWQGLQALGRVGHNPDRNDEDSAFAGGSKEDEPGAWELTTEADGVKPAQANILDGWSAVDQPGADTFLYLGFTREKSGGTSYLAFELNRDARVWNNGHASIPCRTTGDVLVVFAPKGNDIALALQQWTTITADAATGCARTGTLRTVETIPAGAAQGSMNAVAITSRLPGSFAPGSQIPDALFGEAAADVSALLEAAFGDVCLSFGSVWMHSRSSLSESSAMQDYVAPQRLALRTCAASGTKFFDLDADGVRDPGEPGLPRFLIWADYDNDGVRDSNEPFSVTDDHGDYVIDDIRPPSGTYRLRETLASPGRRSPVPTAWRCSYPNAGTGGGFAGGTGGLFGCGWGPISVASTPNAQGRDFGDWVPATLTVEKQLWPADDPGRFDLIVDGVTVKAGAGDGDKVTLSLPPGTYNVSESAAAGTDGSLYRSTVSCRTVTRGRGVLRSRTAWNGLVLQAGAQATCTFVNARPGAPGIAIEKTGPAVVQAGDTLHYTLYVTNPGDLPIPAGSVKVTDSRCDGAPVLTTKNGDTSPTTLDPGDTWTYSCTHRTPAPDADCEAAAFTNVATASGTVGGITVSDDGSVTTTIECPDIPPEPPIPPMPEPGPQPPPVQPLPQPPPSPEPPFVPPGPAPPQAGASGTAGVSAAGARCVSSARQVMVTGRRMSRYRVSVDGRRVGTRVLRLLQRRSVPLDRILSPGRHVLTLRVTFERGSATAPVTLRRTITICGRAAQAPRVTG